MPSLILVLLAFATASFAGEPQIAATQTVQGKKLVLNGSGTRLATLFKVKVYTAALYLEAKSSDADAILASTGIKRLDMHFLRDVPADKMAEGWNEGMAKSCRPADCDALKLAITRVNALLPEVKEGGVLQIVFTPQAVELSYNGAPRGAVTDALLAREMLRIWLGPNPPNPELKSGMLGGV